MVVVGSIMESNPQLVVALAVMLLATLVIIVGLIKFKTVEEVIKLWALLGPLIGAVTAFYFTREHAQDQIQHLDSEKKMAISEANNAKEGIESLAKLVSAKEEEKQILQKSLLEATLNTEKLVNEVSVAKSKKEAEEIQANINKNRAIAEQAAKAAAEKSRTASENAARLIGERLILRPAVNQ